MTTTPKAKKFRIKRSPAATAPRQAAPQAGAQQGAKPQRPVKPTAVKPTPQAAPQQPEAEAPDYLAQRRESMAMTGEVSSASEANVEQELDAIRREGLTGRQLRMARRVAQKHGLPATSDFDAVRLLRAAGIDPFQRSNMLELVVGGDKKQAAKTEGEGGGGQGGGFLPVAGAGPGPQLPQTVQVGRQTLPAEQASPVEQRNREIVEIQRDIARRRRRRTMLMFTRLSFFVILPTLIAFYYFAVIATPMYATKTEFLILKNENSGSAIGGLFSGTQFATNQDSIAVQSYLQSKDAMLRLDADVGFREHFSQDWIDPIQRLDPDASNEAAYKTFKRNITIGYDPTEGVIRMEVSAADPEVSADFSRHLLDYAEERVDNLSRRMRENAVADAQRGLEHARGERRAAQEAMVRLQQDSEVLDPDTRIGSITSQIETIEQQIQEKRLELQALLDNRRPNAAKVEGAQGDIRRLEALRDQLRNDMNTAVTATGDTLAELSAKIKLAQSDLQSADMLLQSALDQLQSAEREAQAQVRYLTTSVEPVPSQDPSYPRVFENTVLSFLIFSGIYLLLSLTASILRDQVNA